MNVGGGFQYDHDGPFIVEYYHSYDTLSVDANNLLVFDNFNNSYDITIYVETGINITLYDITDFTVTLYANHTTDGYLWFNIPDYIKPVNVGGATFWGWDPGIEVVKILVDSDGYRYISYASEYIVDDETQTPTIDFFNDLIFQYVVLGDLPGFILSIYVAKLGAQFFIFPLLLISIIVYQKLGAIPTAITWVMFWGGWNIALPPTAINAAVIMLVLSLAGLITILFISRRSGP